MKCRNKRLQLRLDAGRHIDGGEAFERLLPGLHIGGVIVKRYDQVRQTKLRVRKHPYGVRHAVERRFNGDRDLFLDFFRGLPRIQ